MCDDDSHPLTRHSHESGRLIINLPADEMPGRAGMTAQRGFFFFPCFNVSDGQPLTRHPRENGISFSRGIETSFFLLY